jgi:hypothetical protein
MDLDQFQNPPKTYREAPFWSWNDDLDPQELVRQIGLMDEAGWGGFFMHSRVGLVTPYMGQQWMACIRACAEEAGKRGMGAWLYDEDKWPSGFAGGLSVAANPDYRAQCLVCNVTNRPALIAERIATFAAREVEGQLTDIRPEDAPPLIDSADRVVQFYPQTMALGQAWYMGFAYLDVLNGDAVRAFLESTHEAYARVVGEAFGKAVPGIFTDEPQFRVPRDQLAIPWTADFPAIFQARRGYDLLPQLPALFFDTVEFHSVEFHSVEFHAVRYDYWRTVTELFLENYSRQVFDWCEAHNLAYTGHYNAEDSLRSQTDNIGAAMVHYPYMHVPGIDKLGRLINEQWGAVLTVKQLDSAVCQTGKPRALCENYGCSGQDFAHTGRKWIGDWAYVLGITLNNPHLSLYSMRGERKRDFPQNVFYQQPWWPENNLIADYFARLSYALSQGQRVVDILVIHPIGSAWTLYRPGHTYEIGQLDQALDDLLMALMQNQRDFHLGDEMSMAPGAPCEARVVAGEDGPELHVGEMAYRVVIVPPGTTLTQNTARLLREFAAAGGPVLMLEPTPTLIDGRPADERVLPETARTVDLASLPQALDDMLPFDVRVPGRPAIWAHHRRIGEAEVYFLVNIDRDRGGTATVELRGAGKLEEWDLSTGDVRQLPCQQQACQRQGGLTRVALDFPPVGSHLLVLHPSQAPVLFRQAPEQVVSQIALSDRWELALHGPNALTLDTAQVRLGDADIKTSEDWGEPLHVLDAHRMVANAGAGTLFALRFTFDADVQVPPPVYLAVESPERFEIAVNGQPVASKDQGWWTDTSFRKLDISAAVRAGRNEVVLSGTFGRDSELESVYVVGDFGVTGRRLREENRFNGQVFDRYAPDFRLTAPPTGVQAKDGQAVAIDLTAQGLACFAGRATLRQTVTLPSLDGRTLLELHNLRAALAHVRVNGQRAGTVAWQPHRVDVTDALKAGENIIEIELVGTLRNLLGPHHLNDGDLAWTGPGQFRDKNRWTDDYILVPFGLDGATLTTRR